MANWLWKWLIILIRPKRFWNSSLCTFAEIEEIIFDELFFQNSITLWNIWSNRFCRQNITSFTFFRENFFCSFFIFDTLNFYWSLSKLFGSKISVELLKVCSKLIVFCHFLLIIILWFLIFDGFFLGFDLIFLFFSCSFGIKLLLGWTSFFVLGSFFSFADNLLWCRSSLSSS